MEIAKSFRRVGVTIETIAKAFDVHENTVKTWTKGWDSEVSQEAPEFGVKIDIYTDTSGPVVPQGPPSYRMNTCLVHDQVFGLGE